MHVAKMVPLSILVQTSVKILISIYIFWNVNFEEKTIFWALALCANELSHSPKSSLPKYGLWFDSFYQV